MIRNFIQIHNRNKQDMKSRGLKSSKLEPSELPSIGQETKEVKKKNIFSLEIFQRN